MNFGAGKQLIRYKAYVFQLHSVKNLCSECPVGALRRAYDYCIPIYNMSHDILALLWPSAMQVTFMNEKY